MARAFLHRLIVYVLLVYISASTTAACKPSSNLNPFNSFPSPLPIDQIPIRTMANPQPGYRSVAYFVVSQMNAEVDHRTH